MQTRMEVAAKLQAGVTMDRILDDIRDTVDCYIHRDHLVTRKDVQNIKLQFNMESAMKHKNDLVSVSSWVNEMKELDYNPVVIFKQQGLPQSDFMDNVANSDFLLGIQTEFQRDMFRKFGNTTICMDSTHGTNMYNFNLVTVVVVDDYGEGIPVAWCLSNRMDTLILCEFLKEVKSRTGPVAPKDFMTDDAEQFFSSWRSVFGDNNTRKLLCTWHVDKAWRKAINSHIKNKQQQIGVYHHLRTLLMECDPCQFRILLQEFISFISDEYSTFHKYFTSTYSSRPKQWASCFRSRSNVNTNMHIEAFHRVLKVVYLHHKQNRRVDHLLLILLKIARDKCFERLRKTEQGKKTYRICDVNRRHKKAVSIDQDLVSTTTEDKKWIAKSSTTAGVSYVIQSVAESCQCQLRCSACNVCPHLYTCSCLDSTIHATACKHVHLIHMKFNTLTSTKQQASDNLKLTNNSQTDMNHCDNPIDSTAYYTSLLTQSGTSNLNRSRDKLQLKLNELQVLISKCDELNALKSANTHVQAALSIMKLLSSGFDQKKKVLLRKRKIAPNANNVKQLKYSSTKKKRVTSAETLSKPSQLQMITCKKELHKMPIKCCGLCLKEDDTGYGTPVVRWIECCLCKMWMHSACCGIKDISADLYFICKFCS